MSSVMLTILIGSITFYGAQQYWWDEPTYWIEILFFILFITVVVYYNLNRFRMRQPQSFAVFYLLSIVLKMLGGLSLIGYIVWSEPSAAYGNVSLFIVSYLTLTFLEVYSLLIRSSNQS